MTDSDDMTARELMRAVLRWAYGTDAEMAHPHSLEEAKKEVEEETDQAADVPKTKAATEAKIQEAHEAIDRLRESTDRLAKLQPARDLDEALHQLIGGR